MANQALSSPNLQVLNYRSFPANRLVNKPRPRRDQSQQLCSYIHRICLQNRLEGFDYCIRHILEDRTAPFRQCSYVHPQSTKRCPNAARRTDRRDSTLCPWHIKKLYLKRKQAQLQQLRLHSEESGKNEVKTALKQLEHFCPSTSHDSARTNLDWVQQEDGSTTASDQLRQKISEAAANLNINEDPDDESGNAYIEEVMRPDIMESDSESIDSDHEDPLKHAGVYTAEEVSLVLRDKMLRLQSLYIEQFKHLQYLLREKRRKYAQSSRIEKEMSGNVMNIAKLATSEMASSQTKMECAKLRSLWRYHRAHGPEVMLKRQARDKRRAAFEGENYKPPVYPTCIFATEEETCSSRSLPLTNYCKKHILYDVHQVLFRPCAAGHPPCLNPIISFVYKNNCLLHRELKTDKSDITKAAQNEDDPTLFQTMDDIASLALDNVTPSNFFGLDQLDLGPTDLLQTNLTV